MKILYIHQYFHTPAEAGGTRSYFVAKALRKAGHEVTMLTSAPSGSDAPLVRREDVEGLDVVYLRVAYDNRMSAARRTLSFVKFMTVATLVCLRERDVSLVFATSTPLTVLFPALCLKLFRRIPYVFEVRDVWPEFPIQMGALRNRFLIGALRRFERLGYRHAEHIIALSPGMREHIERCGFADKVSLIPNMSKTRYFSPRPVDPDVVERYGLLPDRIRLVYFGTLGRANGIPHLMDEMKRAEEIGFPVQFVVIGKGTMLEHVERTKREAGLSNVTILGSLPYVEVAEVVNACDVSVVSFGLQKILETNSPNKFFDSIAAGKPALVTIDGWIREAIERARCGLYVDQSRPGDLVEKLRMLRDDPALLEEMSTNARRLALEEFDSEMLCGKVVDVADGAVDPVPIRARP